MATKSTGRSIKSATTPREVYQALVAQITTDNAIVAVGKYASGARVTQASPGFLRDTPSGAKMSYPCRTNKWLPEGKAAVVAFGKDLHTMSLDEAKAKAYEIRDAYTVSVTIWEDSLGKAQLLKGRPFTGLVNEPREYETADHTIKHDISFSDICLDELPTVSSTLSASDFALEDDSNPEHTDAPKVEDGKIVNAEM